MWLRVTQTVTRLLCYRQLCQSLPYVSPLHLPFPHPIFFFAAACTNFDDSMKPFSWEPSWPLQSCKSLFSTLVLPCNLRPTTILHLRGLHRMNCRVCHMSLCHSLPCQLWPCSPIRLCLIAHDFARRVLDRRVFSTITPKLCKTLQNMMASCVHLLCVDWFACNMEILCHHPVYDIKEVLYAHSQPTQAVTHFISGIALSRCFRRS